MVNRTTEAQKGMSQLGRYAQQWRTKSLVDIHSNGEHGAWLIYIPKAIIEIFSEIYTICLGNQLIVRNKH